jgi:hypothetical protein
MDWLIAAWLRSRRCRAATARYRDPQAALADGYMRDPMNMCVTPPDEGQPAWLGAMGVHFFRPDLLGITGTSPRVSGNGTHTDFTKPGVLIYELDNPNTPADEAHGFAPHYELHIWTELPNPAGPFMEWNANATCRYHRPDAQADAKKP